MADPLFDQLLERAIATEADEERFNDARERLYRSMPSAPQEANPISPKLALLASLIADNATTYRSLTSGRGHEQNPMTGYFNRHPWSIIPTAAAGAYGYGKLYDLLKKKSPKLTDLLAGSLAANHGALAGTNLAPRSGDWRDNVSVLLPKK